MFHWFVFHLENLRTHFKNICTKQGGKEPAVSSYSIWWSMLLLHSVS